MPKPSCFLIGDSISIEYGPFLEKALLGQVTFHRKEGLDEAQLNLDNPLGANGGDSSMVFRYLKAKTTSIKKPYDLLMVNCGLHDIKVRKDNGEISISEDEYRQNLLGILNLAPALAHQFVWVNTTPVDDEGHAARTKFEFDRSNANVDRYNAIADEVMGGVVNIDLYHFTQSLEGKLHRDGVHFSEAVFEKQGLWIAGIVMGLLSDS